MKPFSSKTSSAGNPAILQFKHRFGLWYGIAVGLSFAIFAWGVDSFLLSRMNGLFPWLKFLGGLIPCTIVGGLAGWLSARCYGLGQPPCLPGLRSACLCRLHQAS
jgi:hypothetical protein